MLPAAARPGTPEMTRFGRSRRWSRASAVTAQSVTTSSGRMSKRSGPSARTRRAPGPAARSIRAEMVALL